jgi:hypothetical protein
MDVSVETLDTSEAVDIVLERVEDMEDIDSVTEMDEGVGVLVRDDIAGRVVNGDEDMAIVDEIVVGVSGIGLRWSKDVISDPLGLKKDVSKEVSGPSCKASDLTEGDARNIDDSYDSFVSAAQRDSGTEGLDIG